MSDKKVLINNKKANFNYQFSDKYIAGLVLRGTEIKSIKDSSVNFSNSYCIIDNDEIYLKGMVINEYKYGNINNHQTDRDRKLLLNKKEIHQIKKKVTEKKFSLIPIPAAFYLLCIEYTLLLLLQLNQEHQPPQNKDQ